MKPYAGSLSEAKLKPGIAEIRKGGVKIDARGLSYQKLNTLVYQAVENGQKELILDNVNGQRYIGTGLTDKVKIIVNGVPGNDLAAFMDGPTIIVNSNCQDGTGNTMNAGKITVYGSAGDILGHSMRGGKIFIRGDAGYRVGIHMKAYQDLYPIIIIGGSVGNFLGEYMAGGLIIILGLNGKKKEALAGNYLGTGMHGGTILIRGAVEDYQLGKEANLSKLGKQGNDLFYPYLEEYCQDFNLKLKEITKERFVKLTPSTTRPYGKIYAY